ncbi:hypothetical protein N836_21975 [Leptolyngbya sp. Heron Island J]|uniref:hypothetical protein n=1 Tax=Leptolyngbya sp. Heron Island J TaxID=1385935 RepID=UPI0003B9CE88|nr:hypothetical protein [Leptolyngbya sp. Heron Island J]ESA33358.1 hypothetical protein N836_21975 [Leptolyngbya sp. Heron Island J]
MALNKSANDLSHGSSSNQDPAFWQQLDKDFPFEGVDEEQLRQQTEQWIQCASEILGLPPSRAQKKSAR